MGDSARVDTSESNRFWDDALRKVLLLASDQIVKFSDEADIELMKTVRCLYTSGGNKKPPDESAQKEDILKKASHDVTAQFNQLASVHNIDTICEAAEIIQDILSA